MKFSGDKNKFKLRGPTSKGSRRILIFKNTPIAKYINTAIVCQINISLKAISLKPHSKNVVKSSLQDLDLDLDLDQDCRFYSYLF